MSETHPASLVAISPTDHYATLGVPRFAAPRLVRGAYLERVKHHHAVPDALSQDYLRALGEAYWELRHPERRAAYDARLYLRDRKPTVEGRRVRRRIARQTPSAPRRRRLGRTAAVAVSLVLAATSATIVYGLSRPGAAVPTERAIAPLPSVPMATGGADLQSTAIEEAYADARALTGPAGRRELRRHVEQCFADLDRAVAWTTFDYCIALDGFAASDTGGHDPDRYFANDARRARFADTAFGQSHVAAVRWAEINALVVLRPPVAAVPATAISSRTR